MIKYVASSGFCITYADKYCNNLETTESIGIKQRQKPSEISYSYRKENRMKIRQVVLEFTNRQMLFYICRDKGGIVMKKTQIFREIHIQYLFNKLYLYFNQKFNCNILTMCLVVTTGNTSC